MYITLTNDLEYPFNNSMMTVPLEVNLKNNNYQIRYDLIHADGPVESINILEKKNNGFRISFTGSAKNIKLSLTIKECSV